MAVGVVDTKDVQLDMAKEINDPKQLPEVGRTVEIGQGEEKKRGKIAGRTQDTYRVVLESEKGEWNGALVDLCFVKTEISDKVALPEVGRLVKVNKKKGRIEARSLIDQTYRVVLEGGKKGTVEGVKFEELFFLKDPNMGVPGGMGAAAGAAGGAMGGMGGGRARGFAGGLMGKAKAKCQCTVM